MARIKLVPLGEGWNAPLLNPNPSKKVEMVDAELLPLGRALKNYRYFHFIGVVRRHYRAFTRRSGYDVW